MRIATYNAENLFSRPKVMLYTSWEDGRQALEDFAEMSSLIERETYDAATKSRLLTLVKRHVKGPAPPGGRRITLNEVREKLVTGSGQNMRIKPNGRGDWVGWFELVRDDIKGVEVVNTGRVIDAVRPDVLCMVEVEDRPSLVRFNEQVLQHEFQFVFNHQILVDGNDERGIDISLMSQRPILGVRSYTDVPRPGTHEPVFSRDCPEYQVDLPNGELLIVLGNHFKSQGYGNEAANDAKRRDQAAAVAQIYQRALQRTNLVIVAGDLNAGPDHASLAPLIQGTDLRDVMTHPTYQGLPGTYGTGTNASRQKLDYILLSPALWALVQNVNVERRGVYAPATFPHFPEVTSKTTQASDHACLWVDLNL
ncbi:MAG TPA: endonuclease/exonuclease/phosphatase family protein [Gemmatimonadales bacterium]|nr:endonuclease/exonuclease/phosphatase family protein [Gemmatimonadales bacterium]